MRFFIAVPLAFISLLLTPVSADFHIFNCIHSYGLGGQNGVDPVIVGVPSNQFNCNGVYNSPIDDDNNPTSVNWGTQFFYVPAGLCGMGQMNFYWNGGGFNFYADGGDGRLLGTCVQGGGGKMTCEKAFDQVYCTDAWVCLSSVCN